MSTLDRIEFAARQGARVAWYMGHYFASERYRRTPAKMDDDGPAPPRRKGPGLARIFEEMGRLFARDLANAEKGYYPHPRDHDGSLREVIARSRKFMVDLPVAAERKAEGRGTEVYSPELAEELPAYFLQNFHFQTGGYLTEESAKLYDIQVEVLFSGTANAMRRQCLVPVARYLHGRDQRQCALLDVACGTGRFLRFAAEAFPRLKLVGLDLSEAYLDEARAHVAPYRAEFRHGKAEALPFADESFDLVTSIYLFHEVPPKIRRDIAREFARVLKPGGRLVFMDSLQLGDAPDFDGLLESFPVNFHEPFYAGYIRDDLTAIFGAAGLTVRSATPLFLSKRIVADKA